MTRGQLGTPRVRGGHLGCETMWGGGGEGGHSVSKGLASMWLNATWREENNPGWERCPGCLAPSPTWESTRPPAAPRGGTWDRLGPRPHAALARRFIKSERSIILLNFCVSILASNILILVGQSQMLSKVGAIIVPPSWGSPGWVRGLRWSQSPLFPAGHLIPAGSQQQIGFGLTRSRD